MRKIFFCFMIAALLATVSLTGYFTHDKSFVCFAQDEGGGEDDSGGDNSNCDDDPTLCGGGGKTPCGDSVAPDCDGTCPPPKHCKSKRTATGIKCYCG